MFALAASATTSGPQISPAGLIVLCLAAVLALFVAYKIGRFLLKVVLALIVLAAIAGAVWWFWLRQ